MLHGTRCYLAGPIENHNDNWRDRIAPQLTKFGIKIWDPLIKPSWMPNISGDDQKQDRIYINNNINNLNIEKLSEIYKNNNIIKESCLRLVSACDFVICKIGGPTVGTFHELAVANSQNKPILFFTDNEDRIDSMWRLSQFSNEYDISSVFFGKVDDLLKYLRNINSGVISPDKLKWIFLPNNWPTSR